MARTRVQKSAWCAAPPPLSGPPPAARAPCACPPAASGHPRGFSETGVSGGPAAAGPSPSLGVRPLLRRRGVPPGTAPATPAAGELVSTGAGPALSARSPGALGDEPDAASPATSRWRWRMQAGRKLPRLPAPPGARGVNASRATSEAHELRAELTIEEAFESSGDVCENPMQAPQLSQGRLRALARMRPRFRRHREQARNRAAWVRHAPLAQSPNPGPPQVRL